MLRTKRLLFAVLCLLLPLRVCFAHPMGNFSVNHYSKITVEQEDLRITYVIDLAEIPTYQELQEAGFQPNDAAAAATYLATHGRALAQGLALRLDGQALPLHMVSSAILFPPGAGGLPTMKLGYVFSAAYPVHGKAASLTYSDTNYPGHAGWKEVVVGGPPSMVLSSSAPATDRSEGLSNYPTDMLNSPPQDLSATVRLQLPPALQVGGTSSSGQPVTAAAPHKRPEPAAYPVAAHRHDKLVERTRQREPEALPQPARSVSAPHAEPATGTALQLKANRQGPVRDAFTQLIVERRLGGWFLLTATFIALGLGALHALEPGHGKTIVAAYLVGSRGTAYHAMLLGVIVTVAHTASVFALGAVTLYASRYILPEKLYPWLGVCSGLVIAVLGVYMLLRRWTGEEMDHAHGVGEAHHHWFAVRKRTSAVQAAPARTAKAVSLGQLFILGITGGIIPCPAALVVLLSAFALHRVGFGFYLISVFSVGLAAVLVGFGLLTVYARRFVQRFTVDGPLTRRWLPLVSATFMTLLGCVIALRAFSGTGFAVHGFSVQKLGPALFVAGLGLILGIRHSTDTDHVVAISTIVTRQRSIRGATLIGSLWGLGHTITIFVVGCLIILFGVVIPPRVGLSMEFSVGLMLILLGMLNLSGLMAKLTARFGRRSRVRAGELEPELAAAATPASSHPSQDISSGARVWLWMRPLAIGLVHGLAGSAAVALLVLSTIHDPLWALVYLLIFGGGTMLGMMCMTAAMAMPLVYAGDRLPQVSRYLSVASGLVSVCFGCILVYQLGYHDGLFTSQPHWTPQ